MIEPVGDIAAIEALPATSWTPIARRHRWLPAADGEYWIPEDDAPLTCRQARDLEAVGKIFMASRYSEDFVEVVVRRRVGLPPALQPPAKSLRHTVTRL